MNNKLNRTRLLCVTAVFMALVFIVTRFIQIPIPLGYFNIGNSVILIACSFVPMPNGILIGGIGSALADLTSYPEYTIPTLVIKSVMPWLFYLLLKLPIKKNEIKHVVAFLIATLIPLFGYTLTGCILYGSFVTGIAQFPGLFLEYVANIVVYAIIYITAYKKLSKINRS